MIKNKKKRFNPFYLISLLFLLAGIYFIINSDKATEIPLSEAVKLSQQDIFSEMKVESNVLTLIVTDGLKDIKSLDKEYKEIIINGKQEITVAILDLSISDLKEIGFKYPEKYKQESYGSNWWIGIVQFIFFIVVVGAFLYFLNPSMLSGRVQKFKKDAGSISFADIGGIQDVKKDLMEVVGFLKDREYLLSIGATIPKGILMTGEPGVGKTMLARAIATEAKVPFFYITGSEFHSMWVGLAGQKVKQLFKQAKKEQSIIFIDEIDSIAQKRSYGVSDVSKEFDHTLNQLLAEMDGFTQDTKVMVIAATNHPEVLDPAILRPGRFDRKISIPIPNYKERIEILRIHQKNKKFADNVKLEDIARQTSGLTGADLASILNESAILAGINHKELIDIMIINDAIDKVVAGSERKGLLITDSDKKQIAYHEAGHALVASKLKECDKVQRISILPHGNAGGFTRLSSENDTVMISKSKAMAYISMMFGGRVAEELVVGDISSSVQDDIKRATLLATEMVEHYGMGEKFGLQYCDKNEMGIKSVSDESLKTIDSDINVILDRCYTQSKKIIMNNNKTLEKLAMKLLELDTLNADDIELIVG